MIAKEEVGASQDSATSSAATGPYPSARQAPVSSLVAGQTYETWFPFKRETYVELDDTGGSERPTWVPGWRYEGQDIGEGEAEFHSKWDDDGAMLLTVVSLHKPGPTYAEKVFYVRQWRSPDGRVFGKKNLRVISSRALLKWLAGGKVAHLFEGRKGALETPAALFAEALAMAAREHTPLNEGDHEEPRTDGSSGPGISSNPTQEHPHD